MRFIPKILFLCLATAFVSGCGTTLKHNAIDGTTAYEPKYAEGFRILADSTLAHSRILRVSDRGRVHRAASSRFCSSQREKRHPTDSTDSG